MDALREDASKRCFLIDGDGVFGDLPARWSRAKGTDRRPVSFGKGGGQVVVAQELSTLKVVDADTHLTEPHDLWTSRAPAAYKDRVPQVREVDGQKMWTFDEVVLGPARAASVVRYDGTKALGSRDLFNLTIDTAHPGASQIGPRLELMDKLGIWAHIMYPNAVGFGGQKFAAVDDLDLRHLSITIWNDAMAEIQAESGTRLFGMGLVPWWDITASAAEVARIKALGLKGVITNADPQSHGLLDLGQRDWDPLWEAIADSGLPLNFHIGASAQQHAYFGETPWPSQSDDNKLAIGSAMIYLGNARIIANFVYAGIFERFPSLNMVSVESGIGWIPFFLEALDWQLAETAPSAMAYLSMKPSEYFKRQVYGCFWFESTNLVPNIRSLGVQNCLYETDFPHPTCLYPNSIEHARTALAGLDDGERALVMSGNAARVYHLPI
jgi:uncharacterized protein